MSGLMGFFFSGGFSARLSSVQSFGCVLFSSPDVLGAESSESPSRAPPSLGAGQSGGP